MYIISSKLYNFLENCYNEYNNLSDAKKRKSSDSCGPKNLFLKGHDNSVLSEDKEEQTDKEETVDLSGMLPLEGDEEEVREGKVIKF